MKTFNSNIISQRFWRYAVIVLGIAAVTTLTACKTTRQGRSVENSGFLTDYSQLHEGEGDESKLIYIATNVAWTKYTKIYIEPVQLWKSEDTNSPLGELSAENQKMLVDTFYTALHDQLQKSYSIVDKPGPDTLVVRTAVTEAKKSGPVRNLVSTIMPIGLGLSILKAAAFGKGIGVGDVQVEMELLDGETNQRLAAAVDRRVGTKALRTKFDGSWGDVRLGFDYWAERLEERLTELRAGKSGEEDEKD
jgi:hypothetical protein